MTSVIPIIKPIKLTEYQTKQSKYSMVGKLPTRALLVGPSGSGKGILLSNMILEICHDEVIYSKIKKIAPFFSICA